MKKIISNGYIIGLSELTGEDISAEEKESILTAIESRHIPQAGYSYRLKKDLTWERYELPPEPAPEPTVEERIATLEQNTAELRSAIEALISGVTE